MREEELQKLVEDISLKYFHKPFKHQAFFNQRLRTTGGRYNLSTHHLEFNLKFLTHFDQEVFIGIIKHELCHYHLHLEKKGYRHGDADFKCLLKDVNGLRYAPSVELKREYVLRWIYICCNCNTKIYRERRFNVEKFVCKKCQGHFQLQGRKKIKVNF